MGSTAKRLRLQEVLGADRCRLRAHAFFEACLPSEVGLELNPIVCKDGQLFSNEMCIYLYLSLFYLYIICNMHI